MDILIEHASPADASGVLDFLRVAGSETDNLTFGPEGLPFTVESEAAYIRQSHESRDNIMLLAKANGQVIGSASLNRLSRRMQHRGELSIAILKAYWNKGIGGKMITEILNFAKENSFEIIELQVRSDNLAAIHLYEKFGFRKTGSHPSFFKIDGAYIPFDYMILNVQ